MARLRDWLSDPAAISAVIDDDPPDASVHAALITQAQSLADRWPSLKPPEVKAYLNAIVSRIRVTSGCIAIEIDGGQAMAAILTGPDFASINKSRHDAYPANPITLTTPAVLKRAGTSMKLVVPGIRHDAAPDPGLIRLLLRAVAIQDRLKQNPDLTLQQIGKAEDVSPSYVTRLLRLSYLAPDIVAAIIDGHQPLELTANKLMGDTRLPLEWPAQRALLGFSVT